MTNLALDLFFNFLGPLTYWKNKDESCSWCLSRDDLNTSIPKSLQEDMCMMFFKNSCAHIRDFLPSLYPGSARCPGLAKGLFKRVWGKDESSLHIIHLALYSSRQIFAGISDCWHVDVAFQLLSLVEGRPWLSSRWFLPLLYLELPSPSSWVLKASVHPGPGRYTKSDCRGPMGQCWPSCGHQSSCSSMHADTWRAGHQQSVGGLHWGLFHRGASLIEKESLQDLAQGGGCCQDCDSDINKGCFPGPQLTGLGTPEKGCCMC